MKRFVLDIETIPSLDEEASAEECKRRALDALTGKIVCIGLITVEEFKAESSVAIVSQDEAYLLRTFWSLLKEMNVKSFIAHNGLSFDLPYIWRRSVVNQIKPTVALDLRRYRSDFVYDTMCVWGNWESRGLCSLDSLSRGLGIGAKSGAGDQVLQLWKDKDQKRIGEYCLDDCWLTYQCYCRMNFSAATERNAIQEHINIDKNSEQHQGTDQVIIQAA